MVSAALIQWLAALAEGASGGISDRVPRPWRERWGVDTRVARGESLRAPPHSLPVQCMVLAQPPRRCRSSVPGTHDRCVAATQTVTENWAALMNKDLTSGLGVINMETVRLRRNMACSVHY